MSRVYDWQTKLAQGAAGERVALAWLSKRVGPLRDVRAVRAWQKKGIDLLDQQGRSYDIKTDLLAHQTGNLFLELNGLEKSTADFWLFYLPQRSWLLLAPRRSLLRLARSRLGEARSVTSKAGTRTWHVRGVPVRLLSILSDVRCALFTGVAT